MDEERRVLCGIKIANGLEMREVMGVRGEKLRSRVTASSSSEPSAEARLAPETCDHLPCYSLVLFARFTAK